MTRPTTMARKGMVVTPHYLASQAGIHALQEGANAVEAAIAAAAVVAVVYPQANSVGGDNFWLIWSSEQRKMFAINASGRSGELATLDYYRRKGLDRIPARGYDAANTVPGAVSGWDLAYQFARTQMASSGAPMSWRDLLQPAIGYAADGFPVSSHQASRRSIDFNPDDAPFGNIQRFEETRRIFCDASGEPLQCGDILRQTDLAWTLDLVAERGASEFYSGEIARRIAEDFKANEGPLTLDDFRAHKADWVEPINVSYRGHQAWNLPPNTQGMAALGCLNILDNIDMSRFPDGTADYYHLMAEVTKTAFADRDRWVTDPAFLDIPLTTLLSKERGRIQAEAILGRKRAVASDALITGGDTIWIGVVDRHGNAVSLIQSICDGYGSGIVARNTGIVMQNRGKFFALDDTSPNRLQPHKRTFHTLIAGMLTKDGRPTLVYGTMGGEGQPQTQTALVTQMIDFGYTPQHAIEAPRWLQGRFLDLTQPATQLHLEGRVSDDTVSELRLRGHKVSMTTDFSDVMGHAGALRLDERTGVWHGGADPRGDGAAVGF